MDALVDTNILLRTLTPRTGQGAAARRTIRMLRRRRRRLCIVPQTTMELWSVFTRARPPQSNGLGLEISLVERYVRFIEGFFSGLPDREEIHREWRRLVFAHRVVGRQVFDARLVAAMAIHGVAHVLTFNATDFQRYPQVTVVHPDDEAALSAI